MSQNDKSLSLIVKPQNQRTSTLRGLNPYSTQHIERSSMNFLDGHLVAENQQPLIITAAP